VASVSRWHIKGIAVDERVDAYTATFQCLNMGTDRLLMIAITQQKGGPAKDLVDSCRAVAELILKNTGSEEDVPGTSIEEVGSTRLN
jgi:hypothetical protein